MHGIGKLTFAIIGVTLTLAITLLSKMNKKLYGVEIIKLILLPRNKFWILFTAILGLSIMLNFPLIRHSSFSTLILFISLFSFLTYSMEIIAILFSPSPEDILSLFFPKDGKKSAKEVAKEFYEVKTIERVEKILYPYACELFEKGNFNEYAENFTFLIDLLLIKKSEVEYRKDEMNKIEYKIYGLLKIALKSDDLEFSRDLIEKFLDKKLFNECFLKEEDQKENSEFKKIIASFIHKDLVKFKTSSSCRSEFLELYNNLISKHLKALKALKALKEKEDLKQDINRIRSNILRDMYNDFYKQTVKCNINKILKKEVKENLNPLFEELKELDQNLHSTIYQNH